MLAQALILGGQTVATVVLVRRLLPGRRRQPPVAPQPARPEDAGSVDVLLVTLDEASRIGPCLAGLQRQSPSLAQAIVVDSRSADGTAALIDAAARADPRIRRIEDPPLPTGWVGKVWALDHALAHATAEWVLGLDADTEPAPAMVDAALAAARAGQYDVVSFAPRFDGQRALERWLQPALLTTLIYRFGVPGAEPRPTRVMANGQCFLARRDILLRSGGYASARHSFADDIFLARHVAAHGARVGFLDGSRVLTVRAYRSAREMWREWGRSIDAKDATTPLRHWADVLYLGLVQGAPLPILVAAALAPTGSLTLPIVILNLCLLTLRWGVQAGIASSYAVRGVAFWLSPLADPLAFMRIVLSSLRRPRRWRGRVYR